MKIFLFTLLTSTFLFLACFSDSHEEKQFKKDSKSFYIQKCIIEEVASDPLPTYVDYCTCMADYMVHPFRDEDEFKSAKNKGMDKCGDSIIFF